MLRNRFILVTLLAALLVAGLSLAAETDPHQKILVDLDTPAAQSAFESIIGRLDILTYKAGSYAEIAAQPRELALIDQAGLGYKTLSLNMEAAVARDYGPNYGVYHTYSESVAWMDDLHAQYPDVVSEKWSIGQTLQGNDIWALRVSDNPGSDESEPEVLIDSMHHAREIMASEFSMMFVEYLASNYGVDPEITWLVDNRELYVVPIVNPDGQLYNQQTDPYGGGMWRKTRRNNGDGTYGVDPNRNYPYQWGYNNSGSSPYGSDETFRGPYAGSEPCVQALMTFINNREFVTHDSVHTYSNLLLYPWGYVTSDTPDGATFEYMANIMTQFNGYETGQPSDILYDVNGGSIDWVYGAQDEHDVILSFSSEIGGWSDGFWPDQDRRQPLFEENLWPHIYLMRSAGAFIDVNSPVVMGETKAIMPGQSGYLDFTIENQSAVASAMDLSVTVSCDDAWVQLGASEFDIGSLASMGSTTLGAGALPVTVDAGCPDGHLVPFEVVVHMAEGDLTFNLGFMVGTPNNIFADNFESGLANWTLTGDWGATGSTYHSFTTSLTDSPVGEYNDQEATSATLNGSYQAATLSFWHKYDIEDGYDYGRVQVSAGGGAWTTLVSYDGTQTAWQQVTLDLEDYAGQDLRFRFLLETDYSVTEDGWYIDDVALTGAGSDDLAPAAPVAVSPVDGAQVGATPDLVLFNTFDPEGNAVTYGYRVYSDEACTQLVASTDGVIENDSGETAWTCDSLAEGTYYWRAYGSDGVERSLLSEKASFAVQTTSGVDGIVIDGPRLQVLGNVTGGAARLQLSLPVGGNASVAIYDARGARVRDLHSGYMSSGGNVMVWDGRDSHGRNASSGVYFVRVLAEGQALTGRVVVVR